MAAIAAIDAVSVRERAASHDRNGSFPFENFAALRDAGRLNLTVPAEYGGYGLGLAPVCRVVEQIARGDASTALVLAMHYIYHAVFARANRWPPGIQKRVCRESVDGIALINVVRVEPELGTPARDWLTGSLHERVPAKLGAPLATRPRFQAAVGEIEALPYTNERLIYGLAEELDGGTAAGGAAQSSLAQPPAGAVPPRRAVQPHSLAAG